MFRVAGKIEEFGIVPGNYRLSTHEKIDGSTKIVLRFDRIEMGGVYGELRSRGFRRVADPGGSQAWLWVHRDSPGVFVRAPSAPHVQIERTVPTVVLDKEVTRVLAQFRELGRRVSEDSHSRPNARMFIIAK